MTDDARTARLRDEIDDAYAALDRCYSDPGRITPDEQDRKIALATAALEAAYDAYAAELRREGALTTLRRLEPECWCASGLHKCAIHHLLSEAERGEAT